MESRCHKKLETCVFSLAYILYGGEKNYRIIRFHFSNPSQLCDRPKKENWKRNWKKWKENELFYYFFKSRRFLYCVGKNPAFPVCLMKCSIKEVNKTYCTIFFIKGSMRCWNFFYKNYLFSLCSPRLILTRSPQISGQNKSEAREPEGLPSQNNLWYCR